MVSTLDDKKEKLIVPAPVLSEILVHAGDAGTHYIQQLKQLSCFRIQPFDERAAIELASMTYDAISKGDLRAGTTATRAKLKFDRQIIAIARILEEKIIYSDDSDIVKLAKKFDLEVIPVYEISPPPIDEQRTFDFIETGQ